MNDNVDVNLRPAPDEVLTRIAEYARSAPITNETARDTARLCLVDTLGCGLQALAFPACRRHLGAVVAGTEVPGGARVPGTRHVLDPIKAAWDIGCIIRWLDFNDTWLAAEWGHPSDNLGAILAVADFLCRGGRAERGRPVLIGEVLDAMIKAHEIQGVLALQNSFNRVGLDHVLLVRVASAAVSAALLGCTHEQIVSAVSHAFADGGALRSYRHAPNTAPRKSWAAGDATARGVLLALKAHADEIALPSVLSAPRWGFEHALFRGEPIRLAQDFGSYVMENVLFKIAYPAEFHAQTAVEAALRLHPEVQGRYDAIERILIRTHESAIRIISKTGPLDNPADRDHCLQYMVAVALLQGALRAEHYEDGFHRGEPRIDALRERMEVSEEPRYSREYLEPDKRSIANALEIHFADGSRAGPVEVEYPLGHRRRRAEGTPLLWQKFTAGLDGSLPPPRCRAILELCRHREHLEGTPVDQFVDLFIPPG